MDSGPNKTLVNTSSTIELVQKNEIIRIESYQNFMKVLMKDGSILLSTDSLQALSSKLGPTFNSSHKSHIVNLIHVSRLHRDGTLEMCNGDFVPIARRRKREFMDSLAEWLGE